MTGRRGSTVKGEDMTPGGLGRGTVIVFLGKNTEEGLGHGLVCRAEWAECRGETAPLDLERT